MEPGEKPQLDYATPSRQQMNRWKDTLLLAAIGTVFGVAFGGFLFWWYLFRH